MGGAISDRKETISSSKGPFSRRGIELCIPKVQLKQVRNENCTGVVNKAAIKNSITSITSKSFHSTVKLRFVGG